MIPFFSIITPTIQRESLIRCCESVSGQTLDSWEHIIAVDADVIDFSLMAKVAHPQRKILPMDKRYSNYGNTPRHLAWAETSGKWIIHLDDDNVLADSRIFEDIAAAFQELADADYQVQWAIFPIYRHGSIFFRDPPGLCQTDTLNVVARRDIARWPDGPEYTMDGIWVDGLKQKAPYTAFPGFRPIGIMERSNQGR